MKGNVRQGQGANQKDKADPTPEKGRGEVGRSATEAGKVWKDGKKTETVLSMVKDGK